MALPDRVGIFDLLSVCLLHLDCLGVGRQKFFVLCGIRWVHVFFFLYFFAFCILIALAGVGVSSFGLAGSDGSTWFTSFAFCILIALAGVGGSLGFVGSGGYIWFT